MWYFTWRNKIKVLKKNTTMSFVVQYLFLTLCIRVCSVSCFNSSILAQVPCSNLHRCIKIDKCVSVLHPCNYFPTSCVVIMSAAVVRMHCPGCESAMLLTLLVKSSRTQTLLRPHGWQAEAHHRIAQGTSLTSDFRALRSSASLAKISLLASFGRSRTRRDDCERQR